ncbi:uncharacterized protein LOC118189608 [Stegodyphus dumicola]|uniref:uncharacterized protein LOC118189608 n=1 Tax=Stegodyphus dumicola TaxID=202533 RepID=UPI0015B10A4F|nr:uncharacterized protein LOC118189608 [Stegodyphus dumicola]
MENFTMGVVSVYFSPAENLNLHLTRLEDVLNKYTFYFIAGDFNSKHFNWGSRTVDDRGVLTMDFLIQNNIILYNQSDSLPTFVSAVGEGWTDLILSSASLSPFRIELKIHEEESLSDHRYVAVDIEDVQPVRHESTVFTKNLVRINKFCKKLKLDMELMTDRLRSIDDENNLENFVDDFERLIVQRAKRYLTIRGNKVKKKLGQEYEFAKNEATDESIEKEFSVQRY